MNGGLLAVPVAAPLLVAALLVAAPPRAWLHRVAGLGVPAAVLAVAGVLLFWTFDGTVVALHVSGWPAGVSITLAADQFSALMVAVTAVLVLVCTSFAYATGDADQRHFTALVLILSAGVYGAYLTADLFNLFVFLEVMLAPSYVLLTLSGGRRRVAAGRLYLTVSLLSSTIFLAGLGLLYGLVGTVNLGELAGTASRSRPVAVAGAVVLLAMAIKAALVPLHGWLPRAYPHAAPAVTALFSGLLTKVGVYVIFRVYAVVYDGDPRYRWAIMIAALLSMLIGVLGAVGETSMRGVLSFHMVSQIGYMVVGPALFTTLGLAAAIFYILHHVLVKAALLICAGAVEVTYGTGRLDRLGGLVTRAPLLAVAFMVAAMSLSGIPPLSGFVAKLSLIRAAVEETQYLAAGVAVVVGLLTLLSMTKIWNAVFWGHNGQTTWDEEDPAAVRPRLSLVAPALALAAFSVALGLGGQPLLSATEVAAGGLLDPSAYIAAVTLR